MKARRGSHSEDFVLAEELVAEYFDHVEPPPHDEGPLTVIRLVSQRLVARPLIADVRGG